MCRQQGSSFGHGKWGHLQVNDRVAGWADRNEVVNRIDLITVADGSKRHDVMNMDEAVSDLAVSLSEVYAADLAPMAMMGDASSARQWVAFVGIHNDSPLGTFGKGGGDWGGWATWSTRGTRLPQFFECVSDRGRYADAGRLHAPAKCRKRRPLKLLPSD